MYDLVHQCKTRSPQLGWHTESMFAAGRQRYCGCMTGMRTHQQNTSSRCTNEAQAWSLGPYPHLPPTEFCSISEAHSSRRSQGGNSQAGLSTLIVAVRPPRSTRSAHGTIYEPDRTARIYFRRLCLLIGHRC